MLTNQFSIQKYQIYQNRLSFRGEKPKKLQKSREFIKCIVNECRAGVSSVERLARVPSVFHCERVSSAARHARSTRPLDTRLIVNAALKENFQKTNLVE